jgi:transcriptional regulator with XRE-family HTH domain
MGLSEKLANAKKTNWLSDGLSDAEIKTTVELAKISARIERCRIDMGMTQKEFADYMGVTQGMVSKWESREYNFTIKSLNEICQKLNLEFYVSLDKPRSKEDFNIVNWTSEHAVKDSRTFGWVNPFAIKENIA